MAFDIRHCPGELHDVRPVSRCCRGKGNKQQNMCAMVFVCACNIHLPVHSAELCLGIGAKKGGLGSLPVHAHVTSWMCIYMLQVSLRVRVVKQHLCRHFVEGTLLEEVFVSDVTSMCCNCRTASA